MLKLIFKHAPVVSQAFGFTKATIFIEFINQKEQIL